MDISHVQIPLRISICKLLNIYEQLQARNNIFDWHHIIDFLSWSIYRNFTITGLGEKHRILKN